MEIILNGEPREVAAGLSVFELIAELGLQGQRVAVEVNLDIVPRSQHDTRRLAPGDRVEVVRAIGGG